jgi:hypothetical protein
MRRSDGPLRAWAGTQSLDRMSLVRKLVLAGVVIASQSAFGQQSISEKETAAGDAVAKLIERVRRENGIPKLRRIKDRYLRPDTCRRATRNDKVPGQTTGIGPPEKVGMLAVFWYSTLDPNQPPPELLQWAKGPAPQYEQPHRFSVGVCLTSEPEDAEQRYWIEVGTYMSAIKSLLNTPTWD